MNRKQMISMWCGIVAIVLMGLPTIGNHVHYSAFLLWVFLVVLITGGLIYTFKGQKVENTLQDIRDEVLKRRQFKMRKDDVAFSNREDDQEPKT